MKYPRLARVLFQTSTAMLLSTLLAAGAVAGDSITFTLTNGSDAVMDQFYASPPSTGEWEEDILGVDVLEPGESATITIDDARDDCDYDFRAVFQDGTETEHSAVAICSGETYTYE